MNSPFDYQAYRPLVRDQAILWKREKPGWTLQRIAGKAGIQAPYLTNVLKEKAHLHQDQLHSLALLFNWHEDVQDYAFLLLEWERSGSPRRREHLKRKIDAIRREKLETKAHLSVKAVEAEESRFFLNPYFSLIHSFLGLERFAADPARIRNCLPLSARQLSSWLSELAAMGFITRSELGYRKAKRNFHLPKESPVCEPHLNLLHQLGSQQLQRLPAEEKYSFSVNFSADPATRERIQREFLKFLRSVEPLVKEAPAKELYGLRFDLFSWSYED